MHAKFHLSRFNNKKSTPVKPIPLNEYRRIQLQFATNKIKIGQLEPEIQPAKSVWRHYAGPMASRDVCRWNKDHL